MTRATLCSAVCCALVAPAAAHADVTAEFIDPVLTNPAITPIDELQNIGDANPGHFVAYDHDQTCAHRLFVFLPGSGGVADNYKTLVASVGGYGYRSVGLVYPNVPAVKDLIAGSHDTTLPGRIRRERLYGGNFTDLIDVAPPDAAINRLISLINYLHAERPGESWDRFLEDDGTLAWDRIVFAGHSQGAGHSALLNKDQNIWGYAMFSGPGDFIDGGPALWMSQPDQTPVTNRYAFTHILDPFSNAFFLAQEFLGLDASGPLQIIDGLTVGEMTSQILASAEIIAPGFNYHGITCVDEHLTYEPIGTPTYEPTWRYMFGELRRRIADINGDGIVGPADLASVLDAWGQANGSDADLNCDGAVNAADLAWVLNSWS